MVIWYILVNFLRILSTKTTISKKIDIAENVKLFYHRFQNITHILSQFCNFWIGFSGRHVVHFWKFHSAKFFPEYFTTEEKWFSRIPSSYKKTKSQDLCIPILRGKFFLITFPSHKKTFNYYSPFNYCTYVSMYNYCTYVFRITPKYLSRALCSHWSTWILFWIV